MRDGIFINKLLGILHIFIIKIINTRQCQNVNWKLADRRTIRIGGECDN